MTTRQLAAYGRMVMRRLDMSDWLKRAEFRFTRNLADSDGKPCVGMSSWHPEERLSWIAVDRGLTERKAIETTVIHECLHVLYEGHMHPMADEYDEGYELGLNRTAEALWQAWNSPTK